MYRLILGALFPCFFLPSPHISKATSATSSYPITETVRNSPPQIPAAYDSMGNPLNFPVIDLQSGRSREEIVKEVHQAAESWGFFQIVNHGIPIPILDDMLDGVRRFHEQPLEVKKECEMEGVVKFHNFMNESPVKFWRDSLGLGFPDEEINEQVMPQICRKATADCFKGIVEVKDTISELLSEALGLKSDYLRNIKCMKSAFVLSHYYPACPEPESVIGTRSHTDPGFLTILLQDNIGGLQVLHHSRWVDVPYVPGSVIVNLGDMMQLITNNKFKSVTHRVVAQDVSTRVSAAFFFSPATSAKGEYFAPLEEFVSEENPPIYKATTFTEFMEYYMAQRAKDSMSPTLSHFMLPA